MTELLLPFARRTVDGAIVSISDVPRGTDCRCRCPACDAPVLARQGTERQWHFAHTKGEACSEAYEISIHELAKQLLRKRPRLLLPRLDAVVTSVDAYGRDQRESELVVEARHINVEACQTDETVDDVKPDAIVTVRGRRLFIEVVVFHRLADDKRARLVKSGMPTILIDLGQFKSRRATVDQVEEALVDSEENRGWIYHPRYDEKLELAKKRLRARLAKIEEQWEAALAVKRKQGNDTSAHDVSLHLTTHRGPVFDSAVTSSDTYRRLLWRASLPDTNEVESAVFAFCERTHIAPDALLALTKSIKHRSDLVDDTPEAISGAWAAILGVTTSDVACFLREAQYVL